MSTDPAGRAAEQARREMETLLTELVVQPVKDAHAQSLAPLASGKALVDVHTLLKDVRDMAVRSRDSVTELESEILGPDGESSVREILCDLQVTVGGPAQGARSTLLDQAAGVRLDVQEVRKVVNELVTSSVTASTEQVRHGGLLTGLFAEVVGEESQVGLRAMVRTQTTGLTHAINTLARVETVGQHIAESVGTPAAGHPSLHTIAANISQDITAVRERTVGLETSAAQQSHRLAAVNAAIHDVLHAVAGDEAHPSLSTLLNGVVSSVGQPVDSEGPSDLHTVLASVLASTRELHPAMRTVQERLALIEAALGAGPGDVPLRTRISVIDAAQKSMSTRLDTLPTSTKTTVDTAFNSISATVQQAATSSATSAKAVAEHLSTAGDRLQALSDREARVEAAGIIAGQANTSVSALRDQLTTAAEANAALLARVEELTRLFDARAALLANEASVSVVKSDLAAITSAAVGFEAASQRRFRAQMMLCALSLLGALAAAALAGWVAAR